MRNRVFFPQAALTAWLDADLIELRNDELIIQPEGHRYRLIEAVRILHDVTGGGDSHELSGSVKTRAFLNELGAEILDTSLLLGEEAYEVVPGFIGAPLVSSTDPRTASGDRLVAEEQLLATLAALPT